MGVLADNLSRPQAEELRAALAKRGMSTRVVPDQWLSLPPPTRLKRAIPTEAGLVVYNLHGTAHTIAWHDVAHIAVLCEVVDAVGLNRALRAGAGLDPLVQDRYIHSKGDLLTLEVYAHDPVVRYFIESTAFDYGYLAERLEVRTSANFAVLVADMVGRSKTNRASSTPYRDALPSRTTSNLAAQTMSREPSRTALYPSRRHFEREVAWTLWRHHGPGVVFDG